MCLRSMLLFAHFSKRKPYRRKKVPSTACFELAGSEGTIKLNPADDYISLFYRIEAFFKVCDNVVNVLGSYGKADCVGLDALIEQFF